MQASSWILCLVLLSAGDRAHRDDQKIKLTECPAPVQEAIKARVEPNAHKVETVEVEKADGEPTIYWADITLSGKPYALGLLEDGTLWELMFAIDVDDLPFAKLPPAAQATIKTEGYGQKIDTVSREYRYGQTVFEMVVTHKGHRYELIVADDGTLVEKSLIVVDEEVSLTKCPQLVQTVFHKYAPGAEIGEVTHLGKGTGN